MDIMRLLHGTPHDGMLDELMPFLNPLQIEIDDDIDEAVMRMQMVLDVIGFMPDCSAVDMTHDVWTDGAGTAFLHYRLGMADYYITHRDRDQQQRRAFGGIDTGGLHLHHDYISVYELLRAGAALDLEWVPRPLSQVKARNHDF